MIAAYDRTWAISLGCFESALGIRRRQAFKGATSCALVACYHPGAIQVPSNGSTSPRHLRRHLRRPPPCAEPAGLPWRCGTCCGTAMGTPVVFSIQTGGGALRGGITAPLSRRIGSGGRRRRRRKEWRVGIGIYGCQPDVSSGHWAIITDDDGRAYL
jgi:hypothetical protein